MHPLAETLLDEPVIAAVKTDDALTAALASPCSTVFLLASTLLNVGELVRRIHAAGKLAVVHIDLVDGLSAREVAVNSLIALCHPDGIISTQDMDELKKEEYPRINLLAGSVAQPHYSSEFFTVKTAYEFIINNCPSYLDKSILQSCDINNYLVENVTYDKTMSEKVREDILNSIPLANGMIQAGERIVDRGEIIDNHTYNVLRSLKIVHET